MQGLCARDPSGRGDHCFCTGVDPERGVRRCCRCGQWNVRGRDWTGDSDYR